MLFTTLTLLFTAAPVCSYSHAIALENGTLKLPTGETFAKVTPSPMMVISVQFPAGSANQGAQVRFTTSNVKFDTNYLAERGFRLDLLVSRRESPVLLAPVGSEVFWSGNKGKQLIVTAQRSYGLEPKAPSSFALNCKQLTLENVEIAYDEVEQPPEEGAPYFYAVINTMHTPVSAKPGGAPEEYIVRSESPLLVLGELRGFAHVRGWFGEAMLDGWVPRANIERVTSDRSDDFKTDCRFDTTKEGTPCTDEVPLMVHLNGQLTRIGTLEKGALVRELSRDDAGVIISLPQLPWLTLAPGAAFVISTESAASCVRQ